MNTHFRKILIADDDKDDVELLKETLTGIIYWANIIDVPDGIAALRHIKTSVPPDLVFLDLNMPLKNDPDCLRDIHNLGLLADTPIIIYSTSNNIKDIDQAYKYGAACYIVKSTDANQLKNLVNQALLITAKTNGQRADKANFVLMDGLKNRTVEQL